MQTVNTNMIQTSNQQNFADGQHWNFTMELSWLRKQNSWIVIVSDERKHWHCLLKWSQEMAKSFRTRNLLHCNRNKRKQFSLFYYHCKEVHNVQRDQTKNNKKKQYRTGITDNRCELGNTNHWKPVDNQCLQFTQSRTKYKLNFWQQPPKHVHLWRFQFPSPRAQLYIQHQKRWKTAGNNWWRKLQTTEQWLSNLSI